MEIKKMLASVLSAGMIMSFLPAAVMADGAGWHQTEAGWSYYTDSTTYVQNSWKQIGSKWYYFDADGIAYADCWETINGKLYHFDSSCAMETNKWIDCGESYFEGFAEYTCDLNGDPDGFWSQFLDLKDWRYVGADGAAYKGWKTVNGKWYFFEDGSNSQNASRQCRMAYGIAKDKDGGIYCFDKNGSYIKNKWVSANTEEDGWFYFGSNGIIYSSKWLNQNGKWYYFNDDCLMVCSKSNYYISGYLYDFDKSGVCSNPYSGRKLTGWVEDSDKWYYFDSEGKAYKEWHKIGGKWYYFDPEDGYMCTGPRIIGSDYYQFDDDGKMHTGWFKVPTMKNYWGNDYWFYCGTNGKVYSDQWLEEDGKWYYFSGKKYGCAMINSMTDYEINGKLYDFDSHGVCLNPYSGRPVVKE